MATFLHISAWNGWTDAVEYLVEQYPLGLAANHTGWGTKNMASSRSVAITCLICQKYHASLQVSFDRGLIALHNTVLNGRHDQAKLILAAYPEAITVADEDGDLPIYILCANFEAD